MTEDPATGSTTAAVTALLAELRGGADLRLRVGQGVDMGRPSLLLARASRQDRGMVAFVGGRCAAATLWSAVFATVLLCPALPWAVSGVPWQHVGLAAWAGVVYLAFGVTILGYTLWYWALGRGGIARVGLLQFLQPVSGVLLAGFLLGERLAGPALLAAAIILLGVGIATQRTPRFREHG